MTAVDPALLVGLGGAVGAALRYAGGRVLSGHRFPVATLAVNALGTFVLGLVAYGGAGGDLALAVGVGACGAFTTFSSFAFETVRLAEEGHRARAAANAVGNLVAAGLALGLAWLLVGPA